MSTKYCKTKEELQNYLEMNHITKEEFNKALIELVEEGLVEYDMGLGWVLTNPRGVKVARKVIRDHKNV